MARQKNIGEQIGDAIQEAIAGQDFSQLQQTVMRGIDVAAKSINEGLAQAAQAGREAQERREREQRAAQIRRQQELAISTRYASTGGLKVSGYLMAIGGGALAVALLLSSIVTFGFSLFDPLATVLAGTSVTLLVFSAASAGLAVFGGTRIGLAARFASYRQAIGDASSCSVDDLARRCGKKPACVLKDLRKMIARGMFVQGHLDEEAGLLFVTNEAFESHEAERKAALERRHQELLERQAAMRAADGSTITPEAQAILDKGYAYIEQIRQSNADIPGEEVSRKIDQIEVVVDSIFKRASDHPEVIGDLQQLMDYYLPVTVKLLDAYAELDRQPVQSESIIQSKREIEDTLDTLDTAFSKLLDSIFKDMTWDVSTDISVLHTILAQEGLTDNPFDKKGR